MQRNTLPLHFFTLVAHTWYQVKHAPVTFPAFRPPTAPFAVDVRAASAEDRAAAISSVDTATVVSAASRASVQTRVSAAGPELPRAYSAAVSRTPGGNRGTAVHACRVQAKLKKNFEISRGRVDCF